ncbi:glycosyltransferase family 39 protein [Sulfurimonas sp.]|uniref:ArnT family glycosyltransferase n=1 Tax=Sulfurimonas sp. TaxID=2022749 RepID=UPI0026122BDD|nr:glycosyltransferase family 39 protein [Sulfurimonas sp.]
MLEKLYNSPKRSAYTLILIMAILSTIYNSFVPLHGDEAYYWMWSKHLQAGYYDHPPMIAFMIYLTNFISESEWGIRLVNVFSFTVTAFYIFRFTKELSDEKTALNAILIFLSVIIVNAGYIITTTDAPIILFWTLSLYYSYRALFFGSLKEYVLAGVMIGLMMLSKYTSILLITSILLFIVIKKREILFNIKFYITLSIALIIVSPMIWWNYKHDWISFLFQLHHGSTEVFKIKLESFFTFIAGQFGIFSPVFAWILFYYLYKEKLFFKNEKLFFLSLSVVVTIGLFLYKSLYKNMGLNFDAPAYIGGVIIVAIVISRYKLTKLFKWGLLIALFFSLLGRYLLLFHLDIIRKEMYNSDKVIQRVASFAKPHDKFYGDHLALAAYLKYYLPKHPDTDVATHSRYSQYDMWRKADFLQDGLVLMRNHRKDAELQKLYKNVKLIDTNVVIPKKRVFYLYRVSDPIGQ